MFKPSFGDKIIIPCSSSLVPTNVPYTYSLLKLTLLRLKARYPFIGLDRVGTSVMGNNLYLVTIGQGEKEVFYNAAHHANEWITTPILLKFLEDYLNAYTKGEKIYGYNAASLYNQTTLFAVPMVNPDGVNLVNGAINENSAFYKKAAAISENYPSIPFPKGWKANISGIDTNLSYPASWEKAKEIKAGLGYTSPAPRDYPGEAPLMAKESCAVYRFTKSHNFLLTLSYHTQGEVIYWQFQDYLPPNAKEYGELFAKASGYLLDETPYESSFAGYKDWFIQNYNLPGYTIEAGSGENPLPVSDFDRIYKDNLGIMASALGIFTDVQQSP